MQTTDQLINALQGDLKPTKKLWPVGLQFSLWAGVSFAVTWLSFKIFGWQVRPEIVTDSVAITFEIVALTGMIGLSVVSALLLSRPDRGRWAKWLPIITVGLWLIGLSWAVLTGPEFSSFGTLTSHVFSSCFKAIVALSIIPAILLFFLVRQGASTKVAWASTWSGIAGAAVGYFAIRIECWYLEPFHIIFAHGLPVLLITGAAWLLGRKVLHW